MFLAHCTIAWGGRRVARQQRGRRGALQRGRRHRLLLSRRRRAAETLDLTSGKDGMLRCLLPMRIERTSHVRLRRRGLRFSSRIADDSGSHAKFTLRSQADAAEREAPDAQSHHKKVIKTLSKRTDDVAGRQGFRQGARPTSRPRHPRSTRPGSPGPASQHGGPPQEQAGPCVHRGLAKSKQA